jgi:hypothetical protein
VTGRASNDCHKPCPSGQSSECDEGEYCWAGILDCGTVLTLVPNPTTLTFIFPA